MSDPYEGMSPIKARWLRVYHFISFPVVNSKIWFHLYYKHSKQHKKDIADVVARAIAFRKRCDKLFEEEDKIKQK